MCQKPLQNHSVFHPPVASSEYEAFLANTVIKQVYDSQRTRCFTPDTVNKYGCSSIYRLSEWLYCTICDILCLFFALSLRGCPCHIAFTVITNGSGDTSLYIRLCHVSQKKKKIQKLTWTSKTASKEGKHSLPWQQPYFSNRGCAQCTKAFFVCLTDCVCLLK